MSEHFANFLQSIQLKASFWYLIIEKSGKSGANENAPNHPDATLNCSQLSLRHRTGLSPDEYRQLLIKCELAGTRKGREILELKKAAWATFLQQFNLDAEVECSFFCGEIAFHTIGQDRCQISSNFRSQMDNKEVSPPGLRSLRSLQIELKKKLLEHGVLSDDAVLPKPNSAPKSIGKPMARDVTKDATFKADDAVNSLKQAVNNSSSIDNECKSYPLLKKLGLGLDISHPSNLHIVKELMGELVQLQQSAKSVGNKKSSSFQFYNGQTRNTVNAVTVMAHPTDTAFKYFHRERPYLDELINLMDIPENRKECTANVGAKRIAWHLAKKYKSELTEVAEEEGMPMFRKMDKVDLAAMCVDSDVKDWQMKKILKHLTDKFGSKSFPPFSSIAEYYEGVVLPITGSIQYPGVNGLPETVECEYQNMAELFKESVCDLVMENNRSPNDIEWAGVILGGDHGQGAFRLCFRALVKVRNLDGPLKKTVHVAKVTCKKDSYDVLTKTIMDHVTADLEKIWFSKLKVTTDEDGKVVCELVPKMYAELFPDDDSIILPHINVLITGDIAFYCLVLGMEGMASKWCIYCLLSQAEWSLEGHHMGEERTIDFIL